MRCSEIAKAKTLQKFLHCKIVKLARITSDNQAIYWVRDPHYFPFFKRKFKEKNVDFKARALNWSSVLAPKSEPKSFANLGISKGKFKGKKNCWNKAFVGKRVKEKKSY